MKAKNSPQSQMIRRRSERRSSIICLLLLLPTWARPAIPQKSYANGNQLVAGLHPPGSGRGDRAPTSSCSQTKTYTKLARLSLPFSAGCSAAVVSTVTVCWRRRWKTHVRVDCSSADMWGTLLGRPSAPLSIRPSIPLYYLWRFTEATGFLKKKIWMNINEAESETLLHF